MNINVIKHRIYWYLIAVLPFAWFVGGEQFALPVVVLLLLFLRIVFKKRPLLYNGPILIWVLWLFVMMVSVAMVDQNSRYLTWFRNFVVAFSGIAMAYLVYESHSQFNLIQNFLLIVMMYSTACAITGLLGVMGINVAYMSPIGKMLHVKEVGYLHDIFFRSFVQADAIWFAKDFIRPKGLLLYANLLAGVVLVGSGIKVYLLASRKNPAFVTLLIAALLLLDGAVVVATLSRSAWIGLATAFFSVLFFARLGTGAKMAMLAAFLVVNMLALALGVGDLIEKRFVDKANSNEERMTNYRLIGEAVMKDPVHFMFGYGSQRDNWQIGIPVGSHSTPLGMMYKFGFIGVSFFTTAMLLTFIRLRKAIQMDRNHPFLGAVLLSSLVQIAVQALFIEIDVDVVYMMIWWILIGLGLSYTDLVLNRYRPQAIQQRRRFA